jgi:catechol 2,3-dioxygenase-like lactoylglutathione lyase family enzyme
MANQHLGLIALLVRDYDEAKAYYCDVLGFTLIEDTRMDEAKRWVIVAPPGSSETRLLLAKAATPAQAEHVGNQAGGRVFLFLHTDDFWSDFRSMQSKGVRFREEPRSESYGTVVVFEDLYGNPWDMIERNPNG